MDFGRQAFNCYFPPEIARKMKCRSFYIWCWSTHIHLAIFQMKDLMSYLLAIAISDLEHASMYVLESGSKIKYKRVAGQPHSHELNYSISSFFL